MKKKIMRWSLVLMGLLFFWNSLGTIDASAQFYSLFPQTNSLWSTSYLLPYLNPYYYNTSVPLSSFGQFDPSIDLDEVDLSLDILYSPSAYRTYTPTSLQGLYDFSPAPFNYLWNSLVASQDKNITVNPYFATPFYYPLLNKDYFSSNSPERSVPYPLYTLYSFSSHLPELLYTAWQKDLAPYQGFVNALGISMLPII